MKEVINDWLDLKFGDIHIYFEVDGFVGGCGHINPHGEECKDCTYTYSENTTFRYKLYKEFLLRGDRVFELLTTIEFKSKEESDSFQRQNKKKITKLPIVDKNKIERYDKPNTDEL